jgi:hypothetical protein
MIKDFITLVFIVLLFAALTPGLYFTYPRNGPKFVVALCHGVAFALILYFTHSIVRNLFRKVNEGFKGLRGGITQEDRIANATTEVEKAAQLVASAEAAGDEVALQEAQATLQNRTAFLNRVRDRAANAAAKSARRAERAAAAGAEMPIMNQAAAKFAAREAARAAAAEAAAAEAGAALPAQPESVSLTAAADAASAAAIKAATAAENAAAAAAAQAPVAAAY